MKDLNEIIKELATKLEVTEESLQKEYQDTIVEVKTDPKFASATEENVTTVARGRFMTRKQSELGSDAVSWEGIIIGIGDVIDTIAKQKRLSELAFSKDPMNAIKGFMFQGKFIQTNDNGVPVYPKTDTNVKMGRVGKPLPKNSWLRTIYGVGRPILKGKTTVPQVFILSVNNEAAITIASQIPTMKPVKFKAIDKTSTDDAKAGQYKANASVFTKFKESPIEGFPNIETVLREFSAGHYKELGELETYTDESAEDPSRWVVTEGCVKLVFPQPNEKTGNMRLTITDESIMFAGQSVVTVWIPQNRGIVLDFGPESRVFVVGRANRGKKLDEVTRQKTEEPGDVMLNAFGLYAPELFKISPEVAPVTPEALSSETKEEKW